MKLTGVIGAGLACIAMAGCASSDAPKPQPVSRVKLICAAGARQLAGVARTQQAILLDFNRGAITKDEALVRLRDGYRHLADVSGTIASNIDTVASATESRPEMVGLVQTFRRISRYAATTATQVRAKNFAAYNRARIRTTREVRKLPQASQAALGSNICGSGKS